MTEYQLRRGPSGRSYRPWSRVEVNGHDASISVNPCCQCHKTSLAIWVTDGVMQEQCMNGCRHPSEVLSHLFNP